MEERVQFSLYLLKNLKPKSRKYKLYLKDELDEDATLENYFIDKQNIEGLQDKKEKPGEIFILRKEHAPPSWLKQLNLLSRKSIPQPPSFKKEKAVMFIESNNRVLVLSFGRGITMIKDEYIEKGFGLKVSEEMLTVQKLGTIDSVVVGDSLFNTRKQSNSFVPVSNLIDLKTHNIVRNIDGQTEEGFYIGGGDSINFRGKIDLLNEIMSILDKFMYHYLNVGIDSLNLNNKIQIVKDPQLVEELNHDLVDKIFKVRDHFRQYKELNGHILRNIDFFTKLIVDLEKFIGYSITGLGSAERNKKSPILDKYEYFSKLSRHLIRKGITEEEKVLSKLQRDQIKVNFEDQDPKDAEFLSNVFNAISYEVTKDSVKYMLMLGTWYQIDQHFFRELKERIDLIPSFSSNVELGVFKEDEGWDEEYYNSSIADSYDFIDNFDQRFYELPLETKNQFNFGRGKVEPCDLLYTEDGITKFVHVKRLHNASSISHLLSQVYASAKLLKNDQKFIDHVNSNIIKGEKLNEPIKAENIEVVSALIVPPNKYGKNNSQLFTILHMLTLMNTLDSLDDLGYKYSFVQIKSNK